MPRRIRTLLVLGLLLAILPPARAQEPKPPELTPEEQKLAAEAVTLKDGAVEMYQRGQVAEALGKERAALEIRQKLYPTSKYPDGHSDLATSLQNVGFLLHTMGQTEKALPYTEQALAMNQKLYPTSKYPDGHSDLAAGLVHLGSQLRGMGSYEKALPYIEQALAMRQKLYPAAKYPDGHPDLSFSIGWMGNVLQAMGSYEKALSYVEQALAMSQTLYPTSKYPDGHPNLAASINNLGSLLRAMGSYEKALQSSELALAMFRKSYPASKFPDGHPNLAIGIDNLGHLLYATGEYEKALAHFEQSLAMRQKLYPASKYPNGHPHLASSIGNLGSLWRRMGALEKALQYSEQALAMSQTLYPTSKYPDGHPSLAVSINNLGDLLQKMGSYEKALPHLERALAMRQKLYPASKYPDGHPELVRSIANLGFLLNAWGAAEKALPHAEQALAMVRKLYPASRYPDGHPILAVGINSLGAVLEAMGSHQKAMPYVEEGLAMTQRLGRRVQATASEAEALAFVQAQPLGRDAFLSLTTHLPDSTASAYGAVWASKSAITRVLEQRHAAARVAGTDLAVKLDDLKGRRRRIDQLLQDRRLPPAERDALLTKATDERDTLERALAEAVPLLLRARQLDALGPEALTPLLPDRTALIDFVRYTRFEYDRAKPGKAGETQTPSYAVFVLAKGQDIRRIELGEAKPIDTAVSEWRTAIGSRTASSAANQLRDRVWAKLAPHLSAGTRTLYVSPDGDLTRLPWAALPVGNDRVLLEDYAVATVPHGPFVLEALKYPREYQGTDTTLLLGGVDYHSNTWPNLPGTATELTALIPLAPTTPTTLTKADATPKRLTERLPKVRYAHIATHGYFDAQTLTAEQQHAQKAMESRPFGDDTRRVAGKNPLAFTGLVLAGGDVLTGLTLVDLPLENLKLITLSACETGLGELTGGEGVQGLQRAFHLAGCPNVVASLWKVNDAATAALMAKFYHEMWVNKQEPLAALREAQLTIFRRPDLIPDLAGERGAPKLKDAVVVKSVDPPAEPAKRQARADTKLWAAFVLSGVGK